MSIADKRARLEMIADHRAEHHPPFCSTCWLIRQLILALDVVEAGENLTGIKWGTDPQRWYHANVRMEQTLAKFEEAE